MTPYDLDLETDVAQALAWHLGTAPDPACRCTATSRGTDTLGCDVHDDAPVLPPGPGAAEGVGR